MIPCRNAKNFYLIKYWVKEKEGTKKKILCNSICNVARDIDVYNMIICVGMCV